MFKVKRIIFIPPNGEMFINDFSIQRLGKYFINDENVHTTLLKIKNSKQADKFKYIDSVIDVESKDEILEQLKLLKYDVIFHRSWMLAYPFAAKLVENFDNVIINIKDWNFSTKKEYKVMFGEKAVDDFRAMKYIFKNAKFILSHFTKEQAKIWAKKYAVSKNKFIFFPEFCNEENFNTKKNVKYKNPKIVLAGSLAPSSYPEEMFPTKSLLRALRSITKLGIDVSYVLTSGAYKGTQSPRQRLIFQDILYENKFNKNFHLIEGRTLDPSVLNKYSFGFFLLEYSTKSEHLNKYTIPSKFAFYLEAGLPMIINSKLKALSKYIKKYKLGIVFNNEDIDNFSEILDISTNEYAQMVKNVRKFRETEYLFSKIKLNTLLFN